MVKKKGEQDLFAPGWLDRELARAEERNPIVATRYFVVEVTPSRRYPVYNGDGHGGTTYEWTGVKEDIVSPFYDEEDDAKTWMGEHDPDEGKELKVRYQHKRRTTTERWT